ncbi:MAG: 16S rRNA (cytidine(1402)-2'-O)-methyltransferase, partial [Eggerthellaceae bacterium]|nr:16S rRNA (cytidine(1402)-2'-O)-methyltransferase [Eggerthellaceae bacterium]
MPNGKLVIVPTPIGNLADMPPRALDALREADAICAEDTRVTGKLLAALGVEGKRLERLDENVIADRTAEILARIAQGETIAYCTDAGMPGVSDPGLRLVAAARAAEPPMSVEVLPGPTAAATAYVASGTVSPTFYFGGFFPRKDTARSNLLERLRSLDAALIFYESPNRLVSALAAIAEAYPQREIAVARELTKVHEELVRGATAEVLAQFRDRPSIKGEIVLVIDPPAPAELAPDPDATASRAAELAAQGERPKAIARTITT